MTVSSAPERAVPGGVRTQAGAPADARASKQKGVQASRRRAAEGRSTLHDKFIAGVPARIMRPRLVFIACLAAIVCFGVLMVYSASAVEALSERGDPTFFLTRQLGFVAVGVILAVCVAYGKPCTLEGYRQGGARFLLVGVVVLLLAVFAFRSAGGAHRWIRLGSFTLQPSEFAKPLIIILAARSLNDYFGEHSIDLRELLARLGVEVLVPLLLIIAEPDTGTTLIIVLTVAACAMLAGLSPKVILGSIAVVVLAGIVLVAFSPYRLARFQVALDPWKDPYGDGYQAALAIMAFASGGLFGRGIGGSTMKYNYLPEAHNDYILAIIGEELGLVGTLIFFAVFMLMVYAAFKIAEQSPTLYGKLVAAGCATVLGLQFFINVLGILSVTPMTGKTLPFVSYGGSSMWASMILAGLIVRVSVESRDGSLYRAARSTFSVVGREGTPGAPADPGADVSSHLGRSTAGVPHVRTASRGGSAPDRAGREARRGGERSASQRIRGFSVYEGGAGASGRASGRMRGSSPLAGTGRGGYERIDLNADPGERLRTHREVRGDTRYDDEG